MGQNAGPDIQINEEHDHRTRADRARNVGRAIMLLTLIVGIAGAFGGGPLSHAEMDSAGVRLEYERISRFNSPNHLKLNFSATSRPVEISISSQFLDRINIERIDPEPIETRLANEGQTWIFPTDQTNSAVQITIHYRPDAFGSAAGELKIKGHGAVSFSQFYLP